MNLESLVPARETCERLRDAGFPAKTAAAWWTYDGGDPYVMTDDQVADLRGHVEGTFRFVCAAPTLQEVFNELPITLTAPNADGEPEVVPLRLYRVTRTGRYALGYEGSSHVFGPGWDCIEDNAAEAAARLWLALASASLLPPPEAAQTAEGQR